MQKHTHKKNIDILIIALSSPLLVGLYKKNKLFKTIQRHEHTSEVLPEVFEELNKRYYISKMFYANGPGSFMSIKVTYIFLKSFSIIKGIPLFATDAFFFNNNNPIKAVGKLYFVKSNNDIKTINLNINQIQDFYLPLELKYSDFSSKTAPRYAMNAIY